MPVRLICLLLMICSTSFLTACSGSKPGTLGATDPIISANPLPPDGLPGLTGLPVPPRQPALAGSGWIRIHPSDPSYFLGGNGTTAIPASLRVQGDSDTGYALFAVDGFDGDNAPCSLQITGLGFSGDYYVGFSDFAAGQWTYAGPFTDNTEVTVPGTEHQPNPTANINESGVFYFLLIAPAGSNLLTTRLELEIHGGNRAPAPLDSLQGLYGANGMWLSWEPSADCLRPDFAGYMLERAPLLLGEFTPLTAEPLAADYFFDTTVPPGPLYRYRIAAVDVSGNQSAWHEELYTSGTVTVGPPVAILDIPDGPLFGPVDVFFDMSESFDPEGDGIDTYILSQGNDRELYVGTESQVTLTLQPGCYNITGAVLANGRYGYCDRFLKVYPQWEAESVVVADDIGTERRLVMPRVIVHPATGELTMYSQDFSLPGLSAWTFDGPTGTGYRSLPIYGDILGFHLGEPAILDDSVLVPINIDGMVWVLVDDGAKLSWLWPEIAFCHTTTVEVVTPDDASTAWVIYTREQGGGNYTIFATDLTTGEVTPLLALINHATNFDVVWNEAAQAIDIAYSHPFGVSWARYVFGTGVTGQEHIFLQTTDEIDIEINPLTDEPAVLIRDVDKVRFRAMLEDGVTWTAEYKFYPATFNVVGELQALDGNLGAFVVPDGGPGKLYIYDGMTWTERNSVDWGAEYPYYFPHFCDTGGGEVAMACIDDGLTGRLAMLHPGGTFDNVLTIDPQSPHGRQLCATGGDTDIHVVWQDAGTTVHYTSPDGDTWLNEADLAFMENSRVFTNEIGQVFFSGYHSSSGTADLMQWDSGSWMSKESVASGPDHWPVCTAQPFGYNLGWGVFNNTVFPNVFRHYYYMGSSWSNLPPEYPDHKLWDATMFTIGNNTLLCNYGQFGPDNPQTGFFRPGVSPAFVPLYQNAWLHWRDPWTRGRGLDCSMYITISDGDMRQAYWASYGPGFAPVRILTDELGLYTLEELPYDFDWAHSDHRRTVSALYSECGSATALVCSVVNQETWFEWDNFGEWEDLPLPDGLDGMQLPELVRSMDGRWHIIYRDYINDRVMCRSTL